MKDESKNDGMSEEEQSEGNEGSGLISYLAPLLFVAAEHGHVDVVEWLIAKGVDVNEKTNQGSTALHAAARGEHSSICKVCRNER